jgi:hypothetical protein
VAKMKKNKALFSIAFASTIALCAFSGCGGLFDVHVHSYQSVVTQPTCMENGYTTYTCSCGESYVGDETQAKGHVESVVKGFEATCEEEGLTDGKVCAICGETLLEQETIEAGHDYQNGVCVGCGDVLGGQGGEQPKEEPEEKPEEEQPKQEGEASVGLSYALNLDGESYTVTGIGNCVDKNVVIPSTYNGKPVSNIARNAFRDCESLESIIIPGSVKTIESEAFTWCYNLKKVVLENGVTSIKSDAFRDCERLQEVFIPWSVQTMGGYVFDSCRELTVFCQAVQQPNGWDWYWSEGSNKRVIWGYGNKIVTYHFITLGEAIESIETNLLTLPTPKFEGYYFGGWYDNAELSGNPVASPYYSETKTVLYAKWYKKGDLKQSEGLEIVNGVIVGIGTCKDEIVYFDMPIAEEAFENNTTIKKAVFGRGVTSIGRQAFFNCDYDFTTAIFLSEIPQGIGEDIFGCTWDNSDFRVYVPANGLQAYNAVTDECWQSYLVQDSQVEVGGLEKLNERK